jgi:hypothetical protein
MDTPTTNDIFSPANAGRKFIPTFKEWELICAKHFDNLVSSLSHSHRCTEAVARACVLDAYEKILGLSESYLKNPLQPLTVNGWFLFVRQQAEWMLSHRREKDGRWLSPSKTIGELLREIGEIRNDAGLTPHQREETLRNRRRLLRYLVEGEAEEERNVQAVDAIDGDLCSKRFRQLFEAVCDRHKVSDKLREAFRRTVIDEESTTEVVLAVWGATDDEKEIEKRQGNLYRIKNRILGYLVEFAEEWKRNGGDLSSFLEAA